MQLWKRSGKFLLITGTLHNLVGILLGWDIVLRIADNGFFNGVELFNGVFWFLMTGVSLMILGKLSNWIIETLNAPLPPFLGWYLLLVASVGIILMPISGFWLLIPQGFLIIWNGKTLKE